MVSADQVPRADQRGSDAARDSTLSDVRVAALSPWHRRAPALVLALVVLAGAVGLLGVRSTTATRGENGYTLALTYAWVSRTGLDTPLQLRIDSTEPFPDEITVRVTADYFTMWEHQGWLPEPAAVARDAEFLYLTFDAPPAGRTFVLDYDAYIQPGSQIGRRAQVALMVDGTPTAAIDFTTRLLP